MTKLKSSCQAAVPKLLQEEKNRLLFSAENSVRKRAHKVMHKSGSFENAVFNVMLAESYMTPHLHPGPEKIEHIHLVEGRIGIIYFNDDGNVEYTCILEQSMKILEVVPAFTWHTYVILDKFSITYETMDGVYDPLTWKTLAPWATLEDSPDFKKQRDSYLSLFKDR